MAGLQHQDVDSMDLEAACEWLEEREIPYEELENLEEILELIRSTMKEEFQNPDMDIRGNDACVLVDVLERSFKMKSELRMLYGDLLYFFLNDDVNKEMVTMLDATYENTVECLEENILDLNDRACIIVVAGESSAGKSSFLNLLLGTKVLPYSLLCTTSVICQIKNCPEKSFRVINMDESIDEVKISGEGKQAEEDLISKLKPYVGRTADFQPTQKVHHVDIHWPLPILKDHIIIVDTPGIGESHEMTHKVVTYLQKATAFIYIVNSANAGGIQEDTVLKIISEQRKQNTESSLATFDTNCMIFVCNKWDIVEKRGEASKVWDDTIRKLQMTIPGLPKDQIFQMSVTEADRYLQSGLGYTEKYKKLLDGLEKFVPASLEGKVKRHFRWINSFLRHLEVLITSRINRAKDTAENRSKLEESTKRRLKKLKQDSARVKNVLTKLVQEKSCIIQNMLSTYLNSSTVRCHIETWQKSEAPDMINDDFEETQYRAHFMIQKRIVQVIQKWCTDIKPYEQVTNELKNTIREECQLMENECKEVTNLLTGNTTIANENLLLGNPNEDEDIELNLTPSTKAAVGLIVGLWAPIGLATVIVCLPILAGLIAVGSAKYTMYMKKMKKLYIENKADFMKYWATEILTETLCGDKIKYLVDKLFLSSLIEAVNTLCSVFIPRQIERDKLLLKNIVHDKRTVQDILDQFQPLKEKLREHLGKLYTFDLKYYAEDKIDISELIPQNKIGGGSFSDVFSADWNKEGTKKAVAIKMFKDHDVYHQLCEVQCSRLIRHANIVTYYGVVYGAGDKALGDVQQSLFLSANQIMLVQELCDQTLESMIFSNKNLQCGSNDGDWGSNRALEFYTRMAISVCEGLTYMHRFKFLHRDLKSSNILVTNGIAKLCDLGFARSEVMMTSTAVGTPNHMAPELFEGKPYTYSADIYSLGVVLWVMWYGRQPTQGFVNYVHHIRNGKRPACDVNRAMIEELQIIVNQCWHQDPEYRPQVERVTKELNNIREQYWGC